MNFASNFKMHWFSRIGALILLAVQLFLVHGERNNDEEFRYPAQDPVADNFISHVYYPPRSGKPDSDRINRMNKLGKIIPKIDMSPPPPADVIPEPENRKINTTDWDLFVRVGVEDEKPISSNSEETPYAFPNNRLGKGYGEICQFYGAEFYQRQKTSDPIEDKPNAISQQMCKLNLRLECVPLVNQPQNSATLPPSAASEQISSSVKRLGRCVCARSLGDRAVFIKGGKGSGSACYIPAGFSHASLCGHEVALPYGEINNGTIIRKTLAKSVNLCVPNAECRTGYNYVGLRCQCVKTAIWNRRNGTCFTNVVGSNLKSSKHIMIFIFISFKFIMIKCILEN